MAPGSLAEAEMVAQRSAGADTGWASDVISGAASARLEEGSGCAKWNAQSSGFECTQALSTFKCTELNVLRL